MMNPPSYTIVPNGWCREINGSKVCYVSPDKHILRSEEDVIQHLTTFGTCKCGLKCPVVVKRDFCYDPNVLSLPDHFTKLSSPKSRDKCCPDDIKVVKLSQVASCLPQKSHVLIARGTNQSTNHDGELSSPTRGGSRSVRSTQRTFNLVPQIECDAYLDRSSQPKSSSSAAKLKMKHVIEKLSVPRKENTLQSRISRYKETSACTLPVIKSGLISRVAPQPLKFSLPIEDTKAISNLQLILNQAKLLSMPAQDHRPLSVENGGGTSGISSAESITDSCGCMGSDLDLVNEVSTTYSPPVTAPVSRDSNSQRQSEMMETHSPTADTNMSMVASQEDIQDPESLDDCGAAASHSQEISSKTMLESHDIIQKSASVGSIVSSNTRKEIMDLNECSTEVKSVPCFLKEKGDISDAGPMSSVDNSQPFARNPIQGFLCKESSKDSDNTSSSLCSPTAPINKVQENMATLHSSPTQESSTNPQANVCLDFIAEAELDNDQEANDHDREGREKGSSNLFLEPEQALQSSTVISTVTSLNSIGKDTKHDENSENTEADATYLKKASSSSKEAPLGSLYLESKHASGELSPGQSNMPEKVSCDKESDYMAVSEHLPLDEEDCKAVKTQFDTAGATECSNKDSACVNELHPQDSIVCTNIVTQSSILKENSNRFPDELLISDQSNQIFSQDIIGNKTLEEDADLSYPSESATQEKPSSAVPNESLHPQSLAEENSTNREDATISLRNITREGSPAWSIHSNSSSDPNWDPTTSEHKRLIESTSSLPDLRRRSKRSCVKRTRSLSSRLKSPDSETSDDVFESSKPKIRKLVSGSSENLQVCIPRSTVSLSNSSICSSVCPDHNWKVGDVVWARASLMAGWPCIVTKWPEKIPLPTNTIWVRWFGSASSYSLVDLESVKSLEEGIKGVTKSKAKKKQNSRRDIAIQEALKAKQASDLSNHTKA